MTWQRYGDTINTAPEFMKAAEIAAGRLDPRFEAEMKGWTLTLFTYSAAEKTDYVVSRAAAVKLIGMSEVDRVVADLVKIGVIVEEFTDEEERRSYRLVERREFIHLMKTTDKKMEAKRKKDRATPSLVVRVLLRDGSKCRYCGTAVNWTDRAHADGGTYDHREPDKETTPDNYVVCCRGCNRLRADFESPDDDLPLIPAPEKPYYDAKLKNMIREWPNTVALVAHEMGIPSPMSDEVEPCVTPSSAKADTVETAAPAGSGPGHSETRSEDGPRSGKSQSGNGKEPRPQDSGASGQGGGSGRKRPRRRRR